MPAGAGTSPHDGKDSLVLFKAQKRMISSAPSSQGPLLSPRSLNWHLMHNKQNSELYKFHLWSHSLSGDLLDFPELPSACPLPNLVLKPPFSSVSPGSHVPVCAFWPCVFSLFLSCSLFWTKHLDCLCGSCALSLEIYISLFLRAFCGSPLFPFLVSDLLFYMAAGPQSGSLQ